MANEKQTEAAGWRNRLNDLNDINDLSGELSFDKNAAWENLQNKLQEKPRRKKIIWYWAAACLLPLLFWVALRMNKKEITIVKVNPHQENKASNTVKLLTNEKVVVIAPAPSFKNEKRAVVRHANQIVQPIAVQKKNLVKNDAGEKNDLAAVVETAPGIVYKSIDIPDTAISFASLPIAKKKLRVLHVNEIETPVPQFATSPRNENAGRAKSDIKIIFGRTYSINPNNTATDYSGGIKIPLTN